MESVCFTGEYYEMTRAELTEKASKKFEVRKSVTKDLDILVCDDPNSGSSKLEKAKKNGTRVITYDEFMDMVDDIREENGCFIRNSVLERCYDENVENAVIPDGVTEIAHDAFCSFYPVHFLKSLKSLSFPSSLEEIGWDSFEHLESVSQIEFRGTVEQWEKVKGKEWYLLQFVPATSVKCSDGEWQRPLVFVEDGVAVKCLDKSTTSIKLDEGVTAISENAFKECASVLSIELPSTLTEIRKGAFDDCKNVEKIVSHSPLFPFNEKTRKLYDATGKTKKVVLSILSGKEEAKKEKIAQVQNVSASTVLESIMSEHKTNAEVIRDDKNAFLRIKTEDGGFEIVLADSKVSKWMPNLPAFLDFVATGADSIAIRKFAIERGLEDSSKKFISLSKDGCVSWKKKTKPVYLFIPEGVTKIEEKAFYDCDSLKFLVIPEGVKKIERRAFYWCSSIENVVFPDGLEEIGEGAFYNCKSLTKVVIPPSVKKIGDRAFSGDSIGKYNSIKDVTISNGVEIIGEGAFSSCHLLESLTIPGSVQNISYGAFSGCLELKTLEIEKGVGKIEEKAFEDCKTLSEISYTGTVAEWNKIEKGRKWNCEVPAQFVKCSDGEVSIVPKIEVIKTDTYTLGIYNNGIERCKCTDETDELVIPDGITIIEHGAFCDCTGIKSIVFPSSLTKIEQYAFAHCTALKSIELPSSLTIIDLEAFIHCTALESIVIPEGVKIINAAAFEDCTALKSVVFPASLTGITNKVFNHCSSLCDITFKGTMEQWKAVSKYFWGNEDMIAKVVHCADGDVEL